MLIVCGFLLVPVEGVFGTAVSSYLISMSYSLVGIIVALLLYDIAKRLGVTVVIFAAIKGAEQVFVIWGKGVAEAMAAAGMNAGAQDAVIAVAVVAMMLAATLILLSEKELASRWGVRILDAGGLVEKTPEELRRDERAAELAEHARLTPRETEILVLVAQGKNGPAIMQELFIAEGTLKAHIEATSTRSAASRTAASSWRCWVRDRASSPQPAGPRMAWKSRNIGFRGKSACAQPSNGLEITKHRR